MSKKLRALLERKQKAVDAARANGLKVEALQKKAGDEKRELSAEEASSIETLNAETDGLLAQITTLNGDIERERQLSAAESGMAGVVVADPTRVEDRGPNVLQDPKWGFESFGQFCQDVRNPRKSEARERLALFAAAPGIAGNEATGADGGYLVPPEFASTVFTHSLGQDALLPLTDQVPVMGNSMVFPKDETTPWGTDGIRAYWEAEASEATKTKPKLGNSTLRLNKLFALVPITDELNEDASALSAYLERKMGDSIRWKSNDAIINGTGAGQPLGVFAHAAQISVAKEVGQAADTIVAANVTKMFGRVPGAYLGSASWLVNDDAWHQLPLMSVGNMPIWVPNFVSAPGGVLLGRPVIKTQHCQTLGDKGDIQLVDFKSYRTITKRFGIQVAQSMHLYFDAGATAFRATFRLDGQPAISSTIAAARGNNALSPFVTLDDRA